MVRAVRMLMKSAFYQLLFVSTDRLVLFSQEGVGEPLFFQHYDSAYIPTLRLIHKCKTGLRRCIITFNYIIIFHCAFSSNLHPFT